MRLDGKARKNHTFCKRRLKKIRAVRAKYFILEEVNFYALLLFVLLQILRIKRGETVLIMDGVLFK